MALASIGQLDYRIERNRFVVANAIIIVICYLAELECCHVKFVNGQCHGRIMYHITYQLHIFLVHYPLVPKSAFLKPIHFQSRSGMSKYEFLWFSAHCFLRMILAKILRSWRYFD